MVKKYFAHYIQKETTILNKLLEPYATIVDFMADYLGEHTEIVLHDLTDLEHSIVKIRNGHISGRHENDPCTDFVLRVLQQASSTAQYDTNYGSSDRNGRSIKSGSFYIRDQDKKIIGMLCINMETDTYSQLRAYLDSFFGYCETKKLPSEHERVKENLGISIEEMVDAVLARVIANCGCDVKHLSSEGKEQIIEQLDNEGIFLLKGSIPKTAAALGISEPTVYRYLKKLKKSD